MNRPISSRSVAGWIAALLALAAPGCDSEEGQNVAKPRPASCEIDNGGCGDPTHVRCSAHQGGTPICTDIDECKVDNGGCGDRSEALCINQYRAQAICSKPGSPDTSQERPDAPAYGKRGTFAVGYRKLEYAAPNRAKPLTIKTWYPARKVEGEQAPIAYPITMKMPAWKAFQPALIYGHATFDAPGDSTLPTYPLVIFSHGYALTPEWYSKLVEHLASRGFIVLAPEHDESDWLAAHEALFRRPADVRDTLDFVEATSGGDLAIAVDRSRIAVVGHSFGGYTALAIGGARLDLAPFASRCAGLAAEDPKQFLCAPFLGKEAEMARLAGLSVVPSGLWPSLADARVKAVVPIAGDAYLFNEAGLSELSIPTMAIGGTMDFGTPWDWGAELAYKHARSASKALVGLEGASHMVATTSCADMPWTNMLPPLEYGMFCFDPVWDKRRAIDLIEHYATAFLLDVLNTDKDARAALVPGGTQAAGVLYETTLQ